jgi:hypothetical protein
MTFAWYAHLRNLSERPWYVAALVTWGIALFEYLLQVPAKRFGFQTLSLAQLEDHAGGDHAVRVRAVRGDLHAAADELELCLGGPVHPRCRLLHL